MCGYDGEIQRGAPASAPRDPSARLIVHIMTNQLSVLEENSPGQLSGEGNFGLERDRNFEFEKHSACDQQFRIPDRLETRCRSEIHMLRRRT